MDGSVSGMIQMLTTMALPFLLAITVPTIVKAYLADYMGDSTPRIEGRLTFDPLKHADPLGTGLMPLLSVVLGLPILFGWSKPLNVNPARFRLKHGIALYAISSAVTLLVMGVVFALLYKFMIPVGARGWLPDTLMVGVYICAIFTVLSLLPIPPNDGALFAAQFMSRKTAEEYWSIAPYGSFIFIAIIIFLKPVIIVPANFFYYMIISMVGL